MAPFPHVCFRASPGQLLVTSAAELLAAAADERTRALFPPKDEKAAGKVSTVGEKFRSQLTKLMAAIDDTAPFFIRCIKPNQSKSPSCLQMRTPLSPVENDSTRCRPQEP